MESIWEKESNITTFPSLTGDRKADTVVIGGGMAGILISYFLQKKGVDVILLEADRIGRGQTAGTTAKITSQHNLIYHKLYTTLGEENAKQYAQANQQAIQEYQHIIEAEKIDCGFEVKPAYLYSIKESSPLHDEMEIACKLGIQAEFTQSTTLPFDIKGALKFENQAQFHPLIFLSRIAENLTIFEHSKVKSVEGNLVTLETGSVTANHIIFACHYPFINFPGYYFMRQHQERSYVLALKNVPQLDGMYLGIDQDCGWSMRNAGDVLLFGGGNHRTGENRSGGKYNLLREKAKEFWNDSIEIAYWSAQDCMTLDSVPYIGQFSSATPNWYVATGFNKWGMTSSMVSAMILSAQVTGEDCPFQDVFSPQRFTPSASAKTFLEDSLHAVRDLSKQVFAPPRGKLESLPNGHGGIMEYDGEKVGVYKDESGEVFLVSPRCPHLGCQLEWNPDEKSWDCPCHGSRFDYHGKLICNPAQEDLKNE